MSEIEKMYEKDKIVTNCVESFQDKKSINWIDGQPYASTTYYYVKDNLEIISSPLKGQVHEYLKDDENIVIMNVSTFKKLQEKLKTS